MHYRTLLLTALMMIGCCSGCNTSTSKSEVEAKVKDGLNLTDISLVEEGDGKYSGTGTGQKGVKFRVTATQGKNEISYEAASEDGSSKMSGKQNWSGSAKP